MESEESKAAEEIGANDVAPKVYKRAQKVPRVAGQVVPKDLIIEWYDKLAKEGFNEIETFNANMYARNDIPPKNIWRQKYNQGGKQKIECGEEDYWRAARLFYWEWEGWDFPAYKKCSLLRDIWNEYLEGTQYWLIAKKFSQPGRTLDVNAVTYYMLKLKKEFKRWVVRGEKIPSYKPRSKLIHGSKSKSNNHSRSDH